MSIMAKTPSGYKKIGSAYLGERPVDKVFNANGDVIYALQRELTGVPPLLFKGKEQSELLNYRIYGDTVDGNSVGDLVESGAHAGEYKVDVTVEGKNLWPGVVEQGAVATTGDYVNALNRIRSKNISLSPGTYTISCNLGIRCVYAYNNSEKVSCIVDNGGGFIYRNTFTVPSGANNVSIGLRAFDASGAEIDNVKPSDFKWGQIEKGSIATPYEPYHAPVTTPIYLPEQIRKVGDEAEYVDYAEQKQHRVRKNLLQTTSGSSTIFGVTYTVNDDGSITCNTDENGATRDSFYYPMGITLPSFAGKTIILSGGTTNIYVRAYRYQGNKTISSNGNDTEPFTMEQGFIDIYVPIGTVLNNVTIFPMARLATIADDTYEPYIENTDLDVTLPALPTIKGTNTMSVDTEVQPSRMDIKGRIKTLT